MIISWINGSLTASVLSVVASKRSARATWEALEQRYASFSQNRILFFRNELLQTKNSDLLVADYLDRMNVIVDNLALAGQPVSDDELVQIVLNNLGPAFEMTVSVAQAYDTPITYLTLEVLLLTIERRMLEHAAPMVEQASVTAFVAARRRGEGRGVGRSASPFNRGGTSNQRGFNPRNNNNQRYASGNGERCASTGEHIICQICGKPGHPALDCYQRINAAFEGRILTKRLSAMVSFPTTLNKQKNGNWLLDIGANAHITPNLQNLVNPKKYNGNDSVGGAGPQDPDDAFSREI
ncbi:uncharacterized protein LOC126622946 [Malus sylvestris]|uniref:uncharacterized protein LOC126622946 n=1 Tax=Malus sylvestris TaxID=3752 RepID=UPI0021ACF55C|nr:uncharacterized protein LOC126622946 [Malus sylvestris]